jgi:hypothetical protein
MKHYSLMVEKEYAESLCGQVYKILPLYEEHAKDGFKHVQTTILELEGLEDRFIEFGNKPDYIHLLATLESLYDYLLLPCLSEDESELQKEHDLIKTQVFKCTNLVNKMAGLEEHK